IRGRAVTTNGWTSTGMDASAAVERALEAGAPRLLCTATDRDGTLRGPDVGLVRTIVEASGLPVVAAGGVRSHEDLAALGRVGVEAVVVGRAVLEGRLASAPVGR
ncbi:MAG: HisA/HisF-related TIM barrel protein, partial [Actinomycetota bacterium]|nr:HisA/HisF-related TIM barrel protein [Actinomycetota bacterium]